MAQSTISYKIKTEEISGTTSSDGLLITDYDYSNQIVGGYAQDDNNDSYKYYIDIRPSVSNKVVALIRTHTGAITNQRVKLFLNILGGGVIQKYYRAFRSGVRHDKHSTLTNQICIKNRIYRCRRFVVLTSSEWCKLYNIRKMFGRLYGSSILLRTKQKMVCKSNGSAVSISAKANDKCNCGVLVHLTIPERGCAA